MNPAPATKPCLAALFAGSLFLGACESTDPPGNDIPHNDAQVVSSMNTPPSRPENPKDSAEQETTFFILDTTQYSPTFLRAFRERNGWIHRHIELRADSMIVEGDAPEDAIILPTDLPLKKKVRYAKDWNGRRYRMELTRLNISTVAYHYVVDDVRSTLLDLQGTADLDPSFYNGSEGTFEVGEQTYGMNKYHPNDTICSDYLLIGVGSIARASYIRVPGSAKDTLLSMGMDKQ
ncbi:MAG: hypothetical protein JNJ91_12965 [Flavobacteriales bacterium]|nr:hypothetical protein [Flavobacteriales bacterium]